MFQLFPRPQNVQGNGSGDHLRDLILECWDHCLLEIRFPSFETECLFKGEYNARPKVRELLLRSGGELGHQILMLGPDCNDGRTCVTAQELLKNSYRSAHLVFISSSADSQVHVEE